MKKIIVDGVEYEVDEEKLKELLPRKDRPKLNEEYYYWHTQRGCSAFGFWENMKFDFCLLKIGNCFRGENAEKRARMYGLRLEAMAGKKWVPEDDEEYWAWSFAGREVYRDYNGIDNHTFLNCFFLGNTHKTREEAEAWGKKYHEAFMDKFNNK